jgi:homospermidine synthase
MAMDTFVYSWVPSGEIIGQISAHGEVFSISHNLTVECDSQIEYRPSVYFVYRPTDVAVACLQMQKYADYVLPERGRVMTDEIVDGKDEVGVLLLGHDLGAWWVGSTLDIHEAREHVKGQNATTLQVAASALSAVIYAIRNPKQGVCTADELPHEEILSVANRYLGPCLSVQSPWRPPTAMPRGLARRASDLWGFDRFIWDATAADQKQAG